MIKNFLFFMLSYILILIIHSTIINQIKTDEQFSWNNTGIIQDNTLGSNIVKNEIYNDLDNIQDNVVSSCKDTKIQENSVNISKNVPDIIDSIDNQTANILSNSIDNVVKDISFENMTKELSDYTENIHINNNNETDNSRDLDDFYKTMQISKPFTFDPVPTSQNDVSLIVKKNDTCKNDNWNIQKEEANNITPFNDNCDFASV